MSGKPILLPGRHARSTWALLAGILSLIAYFVTDQSPTRLFLDRHHLLNFVISFLPSVPIGGADYAVVVSMLGAPLRAGPPRRGLHAHNSAMIITGALVEFSSGAISAPRHVPRDGTTAFISVIAGGFEATDGGGGAAGQAIDQPWKRGSAEDAAFLMNQARQR